MSLIEQFLLPLINEPVLLTAVIFLLMLFLGEPIVLMLGFITATTGIINIYFIAGLAFLSAVVGEMFWFTTARLKQFSFLEQKLKRSSFNTHFHRLLKVTHITTPLRILLTTRVFTGLTIAAIIYLSHTGVTKLRFLSYSFLVNLFWTPIILGVGYAAGTGYDWILNVYQDTHITLVFAIVISLAIYITYTNLAHISLNKIFMRNNKPND